MENKTNSGKLIITALIVAAPLTYKICKDVFLIGVKDGKATQVAIAKDK